MTRFDSKDRARAHVWRRLADERLARFPFPPHGRIPNFAGAAAAAARLFEHEPWRSARHIKVNPDSPQAHVRQEALARGIVVYVPTPRLAGGFWRLDPARVASGDYRAAARLATMAAHAERVALEDLPQMDAIVTGCAAVTPTGKRCGKGAGYSDIEYAILLELGHRPVPVATTVHSVQIVDEFPVLPNDLPLDLIVTPDTAYRVPAPLPPPRGICWNMLSEREIAAMPALSELRSLVRRRNSGG